MHLLYQLLLGHAFPLFLISAWRRCRKVTDPALKHCFSSRWGLNPTPFQKGGIWIHAVSVGETRSTFPLLKALKQRYPELSITLTSGSTQGALQALKFAPVPIQHQMIPYDYRFAIRRFLSKIQPKLVIIIETEIWPNLYHVCHQQQIPLVLANARLKDSSFQAYQKWGRSLIQQALQHTQLIGAQFPIDAQRFIALGAPKEKVKVLGNLKFDIEIPPTLPQQARQWRQQHQAENRFIWVAASTHDGQPESEEALLIRAHKQLLQTHPDALLILVPRHADRFQAVADLCQQSSLKTAIRSHQGAITSHTQIYLADTVGELMLWFAVADVAFIGGSLVNFGGHNILEPAALSKPVLSGPHFQNLDALYQTFIEKNALKIIQNPEELTQTLQDFADHPHKRQQLGETAYQAFHAQTGALSKLLEEIKPFIPAPDVASKGAPPSETPSSRH